MSSKNSGSMPPLAKAFTKFLNCECTYFPPMSSSQPIMDALNEALVEGKKKMYVPVLLRVDDHLWSGVLQNVFPNSFLKYEDNYNFPLEPIERYRSNILKKKLPDGRDLLDYLLEHRKGRCDYTGEDWEEDVIGPIEDGRQIDSLSCIRGRKGTAPVILAKIPGKVPWKIFAYLPLGSYKQCFDTTLWNMAMTKYFYKEYNATLVAMSGDCLEFKVPEPISKDKALQAALDMYAYCCDLDYDTTMGQLADTLTKSTIWTLQWEYVYKAIDQYYTYLSKFDNDSIIVRDNREINTIARQCTNFKDR